MVIAFKHKRNAYQKILLQVYVLSLAYYACLVFLIKTGLIINYPHLRGTGAPVNYLHLVVYILFVRSTVNDFRSPKQLDVILLCLPILIFVGIAPFYFETAAYKIEHIQFILNNEDALYYTTVGLIPSYWNFLVQFGIGLLFSATATVMLVRKMKDSERVNSEFVWLMCVSILMFFGNFIATTSLVFDSLSLDMHYLNTYLFALYLIIIFSYPFFEPRILYGTFLEAKKKISGNYQREQEYPHSVLESYKKQIDSFFKKESVYLTSDFRQEHLSDYLKIPKNNLSQLLPLIYHKNFNQLVNEKRIDVVLEKFKNFDWLNFSLDGVSQEVGFKSRTTLIKAFKSKTGITPSEYKKKYISGI
jgi:AraC-like DNA-binding protein